MLGRNLLVAAVLATSAAASAPAANAAERAVGVAGGGGARPAVVLTQFDTTASRVRPATAFNCFATAVHTEDADYSEATCRLYLDGVLTEERYNIAQGTGVIVTGFTYNTAADIVVCSDAHIRWQDGFDSFASGCTTVYV